jgi:hypothetical protein
MFILKSNAKSKQRRRTISPTKRNKLLSRSVMELPTADPGSDFIEYYTTEEECETDYDTDGNVKKSTVRIKKAMRSEIRKASSVSCDAMMPPELIITKVSISLNKTETEDERSLFLNHRFQMTISLV